MYPPLHEGKYQEEQEMVADKSDTPINRIGETHLSEREGQRGWKRAFDGIEGKKRKAV